MRLFKLTYIVTLLLFTYIASATIIRVPQDRPTIQTGINIASTGDTVLVDTGRYVENINFDGKNIVVGSLFISTRDTSYIAQTVIDGDSSGSVVEFSEGENSTAVLSGFTLTNGYAENGGGIFCHNSNPRIDHVIIVGNTVEQGGAGMDNFGSSPTLINCVFLNNTAGNYGGGMSNDLSSPSLINCTFYGNSANDGGGMSNYTYSNPRLIHCSFAGNSATNGGGMWNGYSSPIVINSIFWGNTPTEIYSGTSIVHYSNIRGGYDGDGNINIDPLFVDQEEGDLHLQISSLCIDAGTTFFVWNGDTILNLSMDDYVGTNPDMGAYEFEYKSDLYFPMTVGNRWVYTSNSDTMTITLIDQQTYHETTFFEFNHWFPYEEYNLYRNDGNCVYVLLDTAEYVMYNFSAVVGESWNVPFQNGSLFTMTLQSVNDTVFTPFGTFYNCHRFHRFVGADYETFEWFAPGSGLVQRDNITIAGLNRFSLVNATVLAVGDDVKYLTADSYHLYPCYPNPFNPQTTLEFEFSFSG